MFGGVGGSARSIAIHLQSDDADTLNKVAEEGRKLLETKFPGANVQANPNTDQTTLELHAVPNDRRMAEAGWDRNSLGTIVRALGDGAWLGEYFDGQRRLSIILRADRRETPEALAEAPLVTPSGQIIPLGDVIKLETALGPNQIRRLDHRRTVTLTMDPPQTLSLEDALKTIEHDIVPALKAKLPPDANIRLAGSADHLEATVATMAKNFILALIVLFMLMAAMFRSLRDALVVVLTVPVALVGGVLGLRVLGAVAFQPLDLLTMIGFIMMVGVIVNHCDPARRSHARCAEPRAFARGIDPPRAEPAPARDSRVDVHGRARRAADGGKPRARQRHLSRARGGQRRRRRRRDGLLAAAAAEPDAAHDAQSEVAPGADGRHRRRSRGRTRGVSDA